MKTTLILIIVVLPIFASAQIGKIYGSEEDISQRNIKSISEKVEYSINDSVWGGPTYIRFYDTLGQLSKTFHISKLDTSSSNTPRFGRFRTNKPIKAIDTSAKYFYYQNGKPYMTIWCMNNDTARYHQKSVQTYMDGKRMKNEIYNPYSTTKNSTHYYLYNSNERAYRMNKVLIDSSGNEYIEEYTLYYYDSLNKPIRTYCYLNSILQDSLIYSYIDNNTNESCFYHIQSGRISKSIRKLDLNGFIIESESYDGDKMTVRFKYFRENELIQRVVIYQPHVEKTTIKRYSYDFYE